MDDFFNPSPAGSGSGTNSPVEDMGYQPPMSTGFGFVDSSAPVISEVPAAPPVAAMPEVPAVNGGFAPAPTDGEDHLAKFQEQARQALEARDAEVDKQHKEIREKAQAALSKIQEARENEIRERKQKNAEAETAAKTKNEALFSHGEVWDRVASLVDLNNPNDKNAKKMHRMRSILQRMQTA